MSLWQEACDKFVQHLQDEKISASSIEQFLKNKSSVETARQSVQSLRAATDKKYKAHDPQQTTLRKWSLLILDNLDKFKKYGDLAVHSAPESVGMAWFAISHVIGAIQNDYKLYGTFNTALNDITEMVVLIQTYDTIYQSKTPDEGGPIYQELLARIVDLYFAILDFSWSVNKYIVGDWFVKLKHGLQSVIGGSNDKFQGKIKKIQDLKVKVRERSEAAFQLNTTDKLDDLQQMMQKAFDFQQNSSSEMKKLLDELKTMAKPSYRDLALADFNKAIDRLTPWLDSWKDTLDRYNSEKEPQTCAWIESVPEYQTWRDEDKDSILCITGGANSGKSVLGAAIYESLAANTGGKDSLEYVALGFMTATDRDGALKRIKHTLLRKICICARDDYGDELLLQQCNTILTPRDHARGKVLSDPQGQAQAESATKTANEGFQFIYPQLIAKLDRRVTILVDGIDEMEKGDQEKLAEQLLALKENDKIHVRILTLCRPSSSFWIKMDGKDVHRLVITDHNVADIRIILENAIGNMTSLSKSDKEEIKNSITTRARHQIRYVKQVALPFLRTPFQHPAKTWLLNLPDNINETYVRHLNQVEQSYRPLLQTILNTTLVAISPMNFFELMSIHSRIFQKHREDEHVEDDNTFQAPSEKELLLYLEQLRRAGGPFIDIKNQFHVVLIDEEEVRNFFSMNSSGEKLTEGEQMLAPPEKTSMFVISERREHLRMAIVCHWKYATSLYHSIAEYGSAEQCIQASADESHKDEELSDIEDEHLECVNSKSSDSQAVTKSIPDKDVESKNQKHTAADESTSACQNDCSDDAAPHLEKTEAQIDDIDGNVDVADDASGGDDSIISDEDVQDLMRGYDYIEDVSSDDKGYELMNWFHHVRKAEVLWPDEEERAQNYEWRQLFEEVEMFFITKPMAFKLWNLTQFQIKDASWEPLVIVSIYGLTSLVQQLAGQSGSAGNNGLTTTRALHAARDAPNQKEISSLLLELGADPNRQWSDDSDIPPPFYHWLKDDPDIEIVEQFLRHGARTTVHDRSGRNALHYVATWGSKPEVLDLILKASIDEGVKDPINMQTLDTKESVLHRLLVRGEVPIVLLKAVLAHGADVNCESALSVQPLMTAAIEGHVHAVELLLPHIRDINDKADSGRTALHSAAWWAYPSVLKLLLDRGADINPKDKHGRTPLLLALTMQSDETAQEDARVCAEILLDGLVERKASFQEINACTKGGRTPLRQAAGRGSLRLVRSLLEQMGPGDRVWLDKQDKHRGRTPLHVAAAHGRVEVASLLLEHGASPSLRDGVDGQGSTSLEICINAWARSGAQRYEDTVDYLISAQEDEARSNKDLVYTAAAQGSTRILERLTNLRVELNKPDAYGWTPGDLALQFGHEEAAELIKKSVVARVPQPTKWFLDTKTKTEALQSDGCLYYGSYETSLTLTTDHPIPASVPSYYFEVEIIDFRHDRYTEPRIGVGLATSEAHGFEFPGGLPLRRAPNVRTWAQQTHNGGLYASDRARWPGQSGAGPAHTGDILGCGIETAANRIFFTRNGVRLDHSFENVRGRFFPALGMNGDDTKVRTNFGADPTVPFRWDPNKQDNDVDKDEDKTKDTSERQSTNEATTNGV